MTTECRQRWLRMRRAGRREIDIANERNATAHIKLLQTQFTMRYNVIQQ